MTNAEKQAQKPLASKKNEAKLCEATSLKLFSDRQDYVEKALYRAGDVLLKILDDTSWNHNTLLEYLNVDYFPSKQTISRLINHTPGRSISAAQLFDLRRVFGISLDALADGGDPFVFEQMSDRRLVELMGEISRELERRLGQQ